MKHVKWIFVVLVFCSLTSFVDRNVATRGLNVGEIAPSFSLKARDGREAFSLKDLKGDYVLLSFWAGYDAQSRVSNVLLCNGVNRMGYNVKMVSVSFDAYASVFQEAVRMDGLRSSDCYVDTLGKASSVYKAYNLKRGFKNYLLNPDGVIVATNVTAEQLPLYLN